MIYIFYPGFGFRGFSENAEILFIYISGAWVFFLSLHVLEYWCLYVRLRKKRKKRVKELYSIQDLRIHQFLPLTLPFPIRSHHLLRFQTYPRRRHPHPHHLQDHMHLESL